jgi:hypothetical protein
MGYGVGMEENIIVSVRARPLNEREKSAGEHVSSHICKEGERERKREEGGEESER